MHHFCTYFDRNYLTRGLALHESLQRHCVDFQLWILAMDPTVESVIRSLALPRVRLVPLHELESSVPGLSATKGNRTTLEYYFTCTPALPAHVLASDSSVERITYLDADLWFFSDPTVLFKEIGNSPIAIVEHRFSPRNAYLEAISGRFNVSWITFLRSPEGEKCLQRWLAQCLEWCFERVDSGRYADQKYLDDWPTQFPELRILAHPGAGIAPWNIASSNLEVANGAITANGAPLVFYHFHGVRTICPTVYDPVLVHFFTKVTPLLRNHVYGPYIRTLEALHIVLNRKNGTFETLGHVNSVQMKSIQRPHLAGPLGPFRLLRSILRRDYLFLPLLGFEAADLARTLPRVR